MSIPSVGGGDPNGLQRALMNAAEKLLADEAELADSTGKTSEKPATATPTNQGQAMVVDLHEGSQPAVTVEGRWLTTGKPNAGSPASPEQAAEQAPPAFAGGAKAAAAADITQPKTSGRTTAPAPQTAGEPASSPATLGSLQTPNSSRPTAGPVSTGLAAPGAQIQSPVDTGAKNLTPKPVLTGSQAAIGTPNSINDHPTMQMLVMLKKSGVGFNDAVQVLKDLNPGVKVPPKEVLKGFWNTLPTPKEGEVPLAKQPLDNLIRDVAWQKQNNAAQQTAQQTAPQQAARQADQAARQAPGQQAQPPTSAAPGRPDLPQQPNLINYADPRLVSSDPRVAAAAGSAAHLASTGHPGNASSPTLQTVVVNTPANQVYVAGLSTSEFQRLAAMLGANAPAWFWQVRNHRGLRRLLEMPAFARLSAVRVAGVRMLFWLIAAVGLLLFWVIGARFGIWW